MTIEAELHDGRILEFPDGTPPAVVRSAVQKMLGAQQPAQAAQPQSMLRKAADLPIGGLEAGRTLLTGSIAAPIAGYAGIAGAVLPGPEGQGANWAKNVQESLTYQPKTSVGQKQVEIATYPFEKLAEGADVVGGKVTDVTGSPMLGAAANTAIQALPMAAGKVLSPAARRSALLERTRMEMQQKLNAPRDAAIQSAKGAGYVLPPAEANPNLLNRILEGFSGQAKVQQLASTKNQPVTNAIVRKSLGLAEDTPITIEALQDVRKGAGTSGYEPVRGSGRMTTGQAYSAELDRISSKYRGAEKDFPKMANDDVKSAVDSARVADFDAGAGLDAIKIQRQRADKAFRTGDTELGKAHKAVADAIEAEIERNLSQGTPTQILAEFRKARELIAKSYDVQKALKGNDIDARVLAAQLRKGRPMSGGIKQVAEFGDRFKGAAQTGSANAYTPGFLDFAMGGGYAGLTSLMHSPELATAAAAGAAGAATRPLIRGMITSKPYQSMRVNPQSYDIGFNKALAEILTRDPALAAELGVQGSQGK